MKNLFKSKICVPQHCPQTVSTPSSAKRREVKKMINLGFWETAHLPLPYAIIITYFSLRAKCWLRGGVGGQFPKKPKESVAVAYGTFRQGDHLIEVINSQTKKITCWHL